MAEITHGIGTSRVPTSISTPIVAESGIIFAVGTAPVQMTGGKTNEVIMASSYKEAVAALGYSDDWEKYSLCELVYTVFSLYQVSPIFMVNVLDTGKHKTRFQGEKKDVVDNKINLPLEVIAESINIVGKMSGTDFDVFYDGNSCIVEFLEDTTGEVEITYDAVDPSMVEKGDIIGGCDITTHKITGLELVDSVFPKYTKIPDIIVCPNWSHDSEVAAVMSAKAENINGMFEAVAIIDIDTAEGTGVTYYTEAPAWKKTRNFMRSNEIVCFPKLRLGDRIFNFSSQLAALMVKTDNDEDLGGGTPRESASNKQLQADSMVLSDGTEVVVDIQQANYLNDNGIVTALNFYNGFVSHGDWTACFPSNTDPVDYFYCVSRMFKWVAKTVTITYWSYIDRSMTRRIIDTVLQGVNDWLNSLTAEEKIIGGRVEMLEDENSETALMSGKAKFHIFLTPPSPLKQLEFVLEYDASYLAGLMTA